MLYFNKPVNIKYMKLINGKKISQHILNSLKVEIKKKSIQATLAVILVGTDPASHLYVSIKEKRAQEIGINFIKYLLPTNTKQTEIIKLIQELNQNKKITAILIQLPLPKHLNTNKIINTINPAKDADGIHPNNLQQLSSNANPQLLPATTGAIIEAIKYTKQTINNKSIAIIGKSKIVGLPTYNYFKNKCLSLNIYDRQTQNLAQQTSQADILIVAIGQANFITNKYIKSRATIIDVGINKIHNKTVGDVNFNSIKNKASWLTPVPGGIGPITVAILLKNVIYLSK